MGRASPLSSSLVLPTAAILDSSRRRERERAVAARTCPSRRRRTRAAAEGAGRVPRGVEGRPISSDLARMPPSLELAAALVAGGGEKPAVHGLGAGRARMPPAAVEEGGEGRGASATRRRSSARSRGPGAGRTGAVI